jgi:hypothetical protein
MHGLYLLSACSNEWDSMTVQDRKRFVDETCPKPSISKYSKRNYFLPLPGQRLAVCQSLWNDVYSVSKMYHKRMEDMIPDGLPRERSQLKTQSVDEWLAWMETLHDHMPDTVGAGRDDAATSVLPSKRKTGVLLAFASKRDVYAAYCDDITRKAEQSHLSSNALKLLLLRLDQPASKSLFMTRWKSHHNHIKLRRATRFSKCDMCVSLRTFIQDRTLCGTHRKFGPSGNAITPNAKRR